MTTNFIEFQKQTTQDITIISARKTDRQTPAVISIRQELLTSSYFSEPVKMLLNSIDEFISIVPRKVENLSQKGWQEVAPKEAERIAVSFRSLQKAAIGRLIMRFSLPPLILLPNDTVIQHDSLRIVLGKAAPGIAMKQDSV